MLGQKVLERANVQPVWNSVVTSLLGQRRLEGLEVNNRVTGESTKLGADGLFVAVGIDPANSLVKGQLELTPAGYIPVDGAMRTAIPGVYAAGDLRDTPLRQVITAAADGAVAATSAMEYLSGI